MRVTPSNSMKRQSKSRQAVSLLEAVVALVVLAGATLSSLTLFHLGLRRQSQSSQRTLAIAVAERTLEDYRYQARTIAGYRALQSLNGNSYAGDSLEPAFEVATLAEQQVLHSPCSAFDEAADPRDLRSSSYRLTTVVRWNQSDPGVRLVTLVAEPHQEARRIRFTGLPSSLAHDASADISAQLVDVNGAVIPDVKFQFWVKPRTANASLRRPRNGQQVLLLNRLAPPVGSDITNAPAATYSNGLCVLQARARYFGRILSADAPPIQL